MEYTEFEQQITEKVLGLYGDGYVAHIDDGLIENGIGKRGLFIAKEGEPCASPIVYLDEYYRNYVNWANLDKIAEEIYETMQNKTDLTGVMGRVVSWLSDWQNVKEDVFPILLSGKYNDKLQEKFACRPWLDLSVFYMARLEIENKGISYIRLSEKQLDEWGVTEEEVYGQAVNNMKGDGYSLRKMDEIINNLIGGEDIPEPGASGRPEMYVLTNQRMIYGAAGILLGADYFKETLQGRSFYLLPSSIHEAILVMDEDRRHGRRYSGMVSEVNDTVVADNEILSDHAYFYDKENGVLEAV